LGFLKTQKICIYFTDFGAVIPHLQDVSVGIGGNLGTEQDVLRE